MTAATRTIKVYPSKRDTWLVAVLYAAVIAMIVALGTVWTEPGPITTKLGTTAIIGAAGVFSLWLVNGTYYTLRPDGVLLIRAGPIKRTIVLAHITEIVPTRNPLSSPALSLDRLKIRYGDRAVMISPQHKRAFMQDVASRVDHLEYRRDRLVLRES